MDRGFNLTIDTKSYLYNPSEVAKYRNVNQRRVDRLAKLMVDSDTFDASLIIDALFPTADADIFLSHSSEDASQAIQIALELQELFGLKVFIDSCIWGSSHDLQKAIDNKYCRREGQTTYDYDERNRSTAHVHMILSTALQRMIDETDTILFMNTDQSISLKHSIDEKQKTLSPWIHMELNFSSLVRRSPRHIMKSESGRMLDQVTANESFSVVHDAPLNHLTPLSQSAFKKWIRDAAGLRGSEAIDRLYQNF